MWSLSSVFAMTILLSSCSLPAHANKRPGNLAEGINPGTLEVKQIGKIKTDKKLELPLQHTDVKIEISGFVASATVTQYYHNPFKKPIEAVYTFPLPDDAAVDDMQMMIGQRTIKGLIKRKEEARQIYEQARDKGQRASLLEQERPNIFTQSVANIMSGDNIMITIRYVNILRYAEGHYEFVFPMVVGPRYIPGHVATGQSGTGWALDTDLVPDASRITPPVLKPGERSGHDIALSVQLDAGVSIRDIQSTSHVIDIKAINRHKKHIQLHRADTLPNKDFILRYQVAGQAPEIATIAHHDKRGGFFTLIIQPQRTVTENQIIPRELIFIVDTSGSMSGFPIEKSKEAMRRLIKGMRETDTFNVVRFAGDTGTLWKRPKPYTRANVNEALQYVARFQGRGGTEMRKGIVEALAQPAAVGYLRIAFLLTDGYVGNEFGILQAIEKERRGARVFSLGVGSSVNRYLLDRTAEIGRGEAFYVRQDENSDNVINQFFHRVDRPALAHIEIDWGSLDVFELSPSKVPDLWAGQPIYIHGRYTKGGEETIIVRGQLANQAYQQKLPIRLPKNEPAHEAMATVWARQQVRQLMTKMVRQGQTEELVKKVTQLGLTYRLMTQWTSFVAVEEKVVNVDGKPQTVVQPIEIPEGVSYEGVFGESPDLAAKERPLKGFFPPLSRQFLVAPQQPSYGSVQNNAVGAVAPVFEEFIEEPAPTLREHKELEPIPEPEPEPVTEEEKTQSNPITFAPGKASLTRQTKRFLDGIAAKICRDISRIKAIVITGHADNSPQDDFKKKLSLQRAVAVADYLISQCHHLSYDLLTIKGEADWKSIADNRTEAGRAKNRRVEISIRMKR